MAAAFSLFIIAIGAIARFAITDQIQGVDLEVVGTILMVCGAVGLVISVAKMAIDGRGSGGSPPSA